LEGEIETGRRLPGARHPDEDEIRTAVVLDADAVVVREREVHRLDAPRVRRVVGEAVSTAARMRRRALELPLERTDEGIEEIQQQPVAAAHDLAHLVVHEGTEDERPYALHFRDQVDPAHGVVRLVRCRDKWHSHMPEFHAVELREQAAPQGLRCDTCLVRHEKHGALLHGLACNCGCAHCADALPGNQGES
jgi:hypothetical protein